MPLFHSAWFRPIEKRRVTAQMASLAGPFAVLFLTHLFPAVGRKAPVPFFRDRPPRLSAGWQFFFQKIKKNDTSEEKRARAPCARNNGAKKGHLSWQRTKKGNRRRAKNGGEKKIHGGRRPESNRGLLHPKQEFYHLTTAPPVDISPEAFFRPPPPSKFFSISSLLCVYKRKKEKKNNRPFSQEKGCVAFCDGASWRRRRPRL